MRYREVKPKMKVEVYRIKGTGTITEFIEKKGKVEYVSSCGDTFPIKVKFKGINIPQWFSHKELKEVK